MNVIELFSTGYARTHQAAELVSKMWDGNDLTRENLAKWKKHLQEALCAVNALESRAKGEPEPKVGD